jgi:hypothetical protein
LLSLFLTLFNFSKNAAGWLQRRWLHVRFESARKLKLFFFGFFVYGQENSLKLMNSSRESVKIPQLITEKDSNTFCVPPCTRSLSTFSLAHHKVKHDGLTKNPGVNRKPFNHRIDQLLIVHFRQVHRRLEWLLGNVQKILANVI